MGADRSIVLYGPALCGKRTLLQACAESEAGTVERTLAPCGTESLPHEVVRAWLPKSRIELVTIGGGVWNVDAWWAPLAACSAVVLMLDSQVVRESSDREHVSALAAAPACPRVGCIVWTKDDLVTTHGVARAELSIQDEMSSGSSWRSTPSQPLNNPVIATWPTFSTRFDKPASMLAPIAFLMSQLE